MVKKLFCILIFLYCLKAIAQKTENHYYYKEYPNLLDFKGTPNNPYDRTPLVFSDQGSWFGYTIPNLKSLNGFSGPYILSQQYGEWLSPALCNFKIDLVEKTPHSQVTQSVHNYSSGLNFSKSSKKWVSNHSMFFISPHTAAFKFQLKNTTDIPLTITPEINGELFGENFIVKGSNGQVPAVFFKSKINGFDGILNLPKEVNKILMQDTSYTAKINPLTIDPGKSHTYYYTFTYKEQNETKHSSIPLLDSTNYNLLKKEVIKKKAIIINKLNSKIQKKWIDSLYTKVLQKSLLTLQTNWRSASGGLKYDGFFPSYHYKWFYGFWAWDSWKHAAAVAKYDSNLAKSQVRAMFDYQMKNGFIPDCIYRDNLIEENNYRNTKPPLSAWAVWKIYQEDKDVDFIAELYPKIKKQHYWWYKYRDHDKDGLCEYGSTDGTLIAAKWESGMDNAVRFDTSEILKNYDGSYSLNQESVDLNSFLYAEKIYLMKLAKALGESNNSLFFEKEAELLKKKIRQQFFDQDDGWFYDTSLDGKSFIKVKGSEGWIPLWAGVASKKQARSLKTIMMNKGNFNTKVPLQTLDANSEKFEPDGGYWRGPTWIDQAYFGVQGLKNYSYTSEADFFTKKLIQNAEGVIEKGSAIRENYNPMTGDGLEAYNFSWSAAHYLLLLLK